MVETHIRPIRESVRNTIARRLGIIGAAMHGLADTMRSMNLPKIKLDQGFSPFENLDIKHLTDGENIKGTVVGRGFRLELPLQARRVHLVDIGEGTLCLDLGYRKLKIHIGLDPEESMHRKFSVVAEPSESKTFALVVYTTTKDLKRAGFLARNEKEEKRVKLRVANDFPFFKNLQCQVIRGEDVQQVNWTGHIHDESDIVAWKGFEPVTVNELKNVRLRFVAV